MLFPEMQPVDGISSGGGVTRPKPLSYLPTYITVYVNTPNPPSSKPPPAPSDPPADVDQRGRPVARRDSHSATQDQAQSISEYLPDLEEQSETAGVNLGNVTSYDDLYLSMDAVDLSYYSSLQEYELVREVATCLRHEKLIHFFLDDPRECLKLFPTYTWDEEADGAAEEFIQWYVDRFRTELEEQRESAWSGRAFGAAKDTIKRLHKDLTNDAREVVIAIDLETGDTLFVRYGDEDSVTLQDTQKELVEDRYIALLHHHPNRGVASLADLDAADWLKAEFLLVSNPDGTLHRYARVGETMIPLEPTRNPEYAAPVDPLETAAADAAYLAQTLLEMGNPAEAVMRQGEAPVVIDYGDGGQFVLTPLDGVSLEVSQTLAEHLWSNLILEGLEGVPINHSQVRDMILKWQTFSQSKSSRQRDAAYRLRSEVLERADGIQSELKFFHAAQTVNHFMSLNEYIGNLIVSNISAGRDLFDFDDSEIVTELLDDIGEYLFDRNDPILATTLETKDGLPSPYYNSPEDMGRATAMLVDSAIDWDVHMVWYEQGNVEEFIEGLENKEDILRLISAQFHHEENARNIALGGSVFAIDWAAHAVGVSLDFAVEAHRRAIGIAMMFQKHGYNEDDFAAYFQAMMRSVEEQGERDIYTLPRVRDVLRQNHKRE